MATPPELQVEALDGATVVTFQQASILDAQEVKTVRDALYAVLEAHGTGTLVLDLQNVRFLSSQALGVLLTLRRKCGDLGVPVVFAAVRPELARIFEITNLNTLFPTFESRDAALAKIANDR